MRWKEIPDESYKWDDPEEIAEESIRIQRMIVQGYKGVKVFSKKMLEEAENPKHAAISLTGEPTLYPYIGELVEAYKRRGMTTFIVTNGSMPDVIEGLSTEPTQLYITVNSPNRESFNRISRPLIPDAWDKVVKTLSLIKSLTSPVVMRITAIKGVNMHLAKEFAELIDKFEPTYVEPKGYSYVGYSRRRMSRENSPSHEEVRSFAKEIASLTSYKIIDEQKESKVVLLSKLDKPIRFY
jgi:tRNA wybutosine-synthesizing protein 1